MCHDAGTSDVSTRTQNFHMLLLWSVRPCLTAVWHFVRTTFAVIAGSLQWSAFRPSATGRRLAAYSFPESPSLLASFVPLVCRYSVGPKLTSKPLVPYADAYSAKPAAVDAPGYGYNGKLQELIGSEFPQTQAKVYVDHAGATLYSRSQINAVKQVSRPERQRCSPCIAAWHAACQVGTFNFDAIVAHALLSYMHMAKRPLAAEVRLEYI